MNDEQKEQLKQNLIGLMESVGTPKPEPLSKTFRAKLYVKRFLRRLAYPITYFIQKRELKRIKAEMAQASQDVVNAQLYSFQKGREFLDALVAYVPEDEDF